MDPEPVEAGLLDHNDRKAPPRSRQCLLVESRKARQQPGDVAAAHRMLRHLLSVARRQRRDQPARSTQFHRHENCAKIGADGGRLFGSGQLRSGMVVSRVVGGQPHSAIEQIAIHPPMGSACPVEWDCRHSDRCAFSDWGFVPTLGRCEAGRCDRAPPETCGTSAGRRRASREASSPSPPTGLLVASRHARVPLEIGLAAGWRCALRNRARRPVLLRDSVLARETRGEDPRCRGLPFELKPGVDW